MIRTLALLAASTLALSACQDEAGSGGAGGGARDYIRAVGSSTVFPFTTAVAEAFRNNNPGFKAPIVESTGTGAGISQFCAGVGANTPDVANASRRMKPDEYQLCTSNGVDQVVELQIGVDGLAVAGSKEGPAWNLTLVDLYNAIAANPFGQPNTAKTWADVNPSLPAIPIVVYGPPSTSGTRDSLTELLMQPACETDAATAALEDSNEDRFKDVCTRVREDGAYVDSGETDNLIVQKLGANPNAIGIFGYSFLEENLNTLRGVPLNGVEPTYDAIASFDYPGARPLYIYLKTAHLQAIPGLREFVGEYARAWGPDGYLVDRGLIAAQENVRAANAQMATALTPLDPAVLN